VEYRFAHDFAPRHDHADEARTDEARQGGDKCEHGNVAAQQEDYIARFLLDPYPRGGWIDQQGRRAHDGVHHAGRPASARSNAAPFSAIIMVGALVFPEVIVGMTEASMTRSRSTPATPRRSSTTISGSLASPIFA